MPEKRLLKPRSPSFTFIIQLHQLRAMLNLGLVPDPATHQPWEPNLEEARFELELLEILRFKTEGNLTSEEETLLAEVLAATRAALGEVERQMAEDSPPAPETRSPRESRKKRRIVLPGDEG